MIQLPNGCRCSELKVKPTNWQSPKASVKKPWYIHYRFYDPREKSRYPKGKLRIIKGMNEVKTLVERQTLVRGLIDIELRELKNFGYNIISSQHELISDTSALIHPESPLLYALRKSYERAGFSGQTLLDIKSVLKYIEKAAIQLQLDCTSIKDIKPSKIMMLLQQCGKIKKRWTANNYNTYLKYLSILFSQLVQFGTVEVNPIRDLKKKKTIKQLRRILTPEECQKIDVFTKQYDENLWRFIHIFFHSGSRRTEILKVQGKHVDLINQKVQYLVLKGQHYHWVERVIKDTSLTLWKAAMQGCSHTDYVFSKGLKPGPSPIRPEQITRRWRRHIKQKLGIACDFYSLKHLNTDQTAALLDIEAAASHNSHQSSSITMVYAVNEKQRMQQRLMKLKNGFV